MNRVVLAACVLCLVHARIAHGQSVTAEASVTAGYSTDEVAAAAAQVRVFGDLKTIRFFGETAWAGRSDPPDPVESDSFGAAYPYGNKVQIIEAYGERMFRPRARALVGVRAGRFRPPFGIFSSSDHAYTGFLRAPLMRYDEYTVISNHFLEHGIDVVAGVPRLTIETAFGAPADIGAAVRRPGLDAVVRVQGYTGPFIVGASYIRTSPTQSDLLAPGRAHGTGMDVRWMRSGVQVRGEWMTGRPSDVARTTAWYADVLVHRRGMGPVTAVGRVEQLRYTAGAAGSDEALRRQTIGARIYLTYSLWLNVNLVHQTGDEEEYPPTALDLALTWSGRKKK